MTESYQLDCNNMVCPIPVAKTKKILLHMKTGDILEVSGDFCEAGENIKRFVESHGGKVLDFHAEGDGYFLKIKKL